MREPIWTWPFVSNEQDGKAECQARTESAAATDDKTQAGMGGPTEVAEVI
jgi:hypothetical protein